MTQGGAVIGTRVTGARDVEKDFQETVYEDRQATLTELIADMEKNPDQYKNIWPSPVVLGVPALRRLSSSVACTQVRRA